MALQRRAYARGGQVRGVALGAALLAAVLAAVPRAPAGAAGPGGMATTYDLFLGGIRLAELQLDAEIGRLGYSATARLETTGLVKRFVDAGFAARAEGRIARDRLMPERFEAETRDREERRRIAIRYPGGRPALEAEPPFKPRPWGIDPAEQKGLPDPLTGALMALVPRDGAPPCGREVGVFDGRKRYALLLGEPEARENGLIRCEARYRRIAGFRPKRMERPELPLTLWFDRGRAGAPRLLRAVAPTPFGQAVLRRRGAG